MNLDASNIPCRVSDFRTIRNEALCYVDKTAYLTTRELVGRFVLHDRSRRFGTSLFISMMRHDYGIDEKGGILSELVYSGDMRHSYIVELKYSKSDATEAALAKDTESHLILYHSKGKEIFRLEELKG